MSLWEYKIITSGKGGFARPDLLEKFLNDLGRDEWEIIEFHTAPDNFLVFTGLARRLTQRDWTLEDAAAAAAKVEAEKLRAEFEAKFKAATAPAPVEERPADFLQEKVAPDDGFRKPVDTSHDADPDAEEEEEKDEWEKLTAEEDELPTFFEAIKPHMRRNQRGPGMSVGVDYLAKKWDQSEDDLKNALAECGFVVPEDEDAKAEYLEYDGDLYWLNVNRRGELWINTKEKPRPVFRPVKAQKIAVEEDRKPDDRAKKSAEESGKSEDARQGEPAERKSDEGQPAETAAEGTEQPAGEATGKPAKSEGPAAELPQGAALLKKIRPHMRRNRRGPGGSGSTSFLSRALKTSEPDLKAAFATLGLKIPTSANEKPSYLEIGNEVWWLNADSRGGMWINGREKRAGEIIAPTADEPGGEPPAAAGGGEPGPEAVPAVGEGGAEAAAAGTGELAAVASTTNATGAESLPAGEPAADNREQQPLTPVGPNSATEMAAPVAPVLTNGPQAGETGPAAGAQPVAADQAGVLAGLRPLLKETRSGTAAARLDRLAEEAGKSADELMAALVAAGLKVPEKPREKSVLVEHGGEVLWLNRNAKSELWLNAKASKLADMKEDEDDAEGEGSGEDEEPDSEKKAKRSRTRKKPENESA